MGQDGLKREKKNNCQRMEILQLYQFIKKGDNKVCDNYRDISLMSVPENVYETIRGKKMHRKISYYV